MARKKKATKKTGGRKVKRGKPKGNRKKAKGRLSPAKKYAIARVLLSGIPASHLAKLFGVSQLSVYSWGKAVKKAGGRNPFEGEGGFTPKQKRLLAIAKKTR